MVGNLAAVKLRYRKNVGLISTFAMIKTQINSMTILPAFHDANACLPTYHRNHSYNHRLGAQRDGIELDALYHQQTMEDKDVKNDLISVEHSQIRRSGAGMRLQSCIYAASAQVGLTAGERQPVVHANALGANPVVRACQTNKRELLDGRSKLATSAVTGACRRRKVWP